MAKPGLLESLRKAYLGNYGVIQSLLGCLDWGLQSKKLVDKVIDTSASCLLFWAFRSRLWKKTC